MPPRTPVLLLAAASLLLLFVAPRVHAAADAPPPQQPRWAPCEWPDADAAVQRFSKLLTFRTQSSLSPEHEPSHVVDAAQFEAAHAFLQRSYPRVWSTLQVERVGAGGKYSLLFTWRGSQPELLPALFISHIDVVPVTPGTEAEWEHGPFSGDVANGYIWGRGALDVKNGVSGLLEGVESLLAAGFAPRRTLMLAFGQDEEVGGAAGAAETAALLASRGVRLAMVWDEGGLIYGEGLPPFTTQPVALVATAEKFYQTLNVTIHSGGGHSSMPPIDGSSVAARLGRLLTGVADSPLRPRVVSPTREFLSGLLELAPAWLMPLRILSKFAPRRVEALLAALMSTLNPQAAAFVRDTAAVTMLQAGVADNVLPQTAEVSINFRLLPGSDPHDTPVAAVRGWLGPDAGKFANLTLVPPGDMAPSVVTDHQGAPFALVKAAIQAAWQLEGPPGSSTSAAATPVPVVPFLMPGGTDSKHFQNLTHAILRFSPASLTNADLKRIHGTNERISVGDYVRLLCTYRAGLKLAGEGVGGGDGGNGMAAAGSNGRDGSVAAA